MAWDKLHGRNVTLYHIAFKLSHVAIAMLKCFTKRYCCVNSFVFDSIPLWLGVIYDVEQLHFKRTSWVALMFFVSSNG